jgi:hypothetical protein
MTTIQGIDTVAVETVSLVVSQARILTVSHGFKGYGWVRLAEYH